jgi:hemin uptake protein HemP
MPGPESPPANVPVRPGACPTAASLTRSVSSNDLFGGAKTVVIEHAGEHYRLIVTKNNRLLLQK